MIQNQETQNHIIEDFKTTTNNNFDFSTFQVNACNAITEGKHVLVTAHTGSGKTLPAEFAIYYFIRHNKKKVIYTSPIKALSNQKYEEFSKRFPDISIGILTGDIKHNPGGDLLIMTTEILQNHCFKTNNGSKFTDFNIDLHSELGCVIFDEVHYIDNPERGTVWEQTMIMLPNNIPYVMLSATIGKKEIFARWIKTITNKDVVLCSTNERVVPLEFYEYFTVPQKYIENIRDKTKKKLFEDKIGKKLCCFKNNDTYTPSIISKTRYCLKELEKDKFRVHRKFVINDCIECLKERDMFPALFFVFSRKQVEQISSEITTNLFIENEKDACVEPVFRQILVSKVTNWKEYITLPEYKTYLDLLEKGIGIHHAGMLPIFKEIMEILYTRRYIKVMIATETFAIGLNMPTRTVVFTSLHKHDGHLKRPLESHEFIQMAGRAGRRNIDTKGYVILLNNCYDLLDESQYYSLLFSGPKVLRSKFKINYNFILNSISNNTIDSIIISINKSLMTDDINKQIYETKQKIQNLTNSIVELDKILCSRGENTLQICQEYDCLLMKKQLSKNKEKKRLGKLVEKFRLENKYELDLFDEVYLNRQNKLKSLETENNYLDYSQSFITQQVHSVTDILVLSNYISNAKELTTKGKLASYIHELHPLVFVDFYTKYMKNSSSYSDTTSSILTEKDIVCILSCFCDIKVSDEEKINVPVFCKQYLEYIQSRINYYVDEEAKKHLYMTENIVLQYELQEYIVKWYEDVNTVEESLTFFHIMKTETSIFIGDFVKATLKICNMLNEIDIICKEDMNYHLLERSQLIKQKLQKNIITNSSLYV